MKGTTIINDKIYQYDLSRGIDISIPFINGSMGPNCFYAPIFEASPLVANGFIGSTLEGSPVNFYNVKINPHGNGTHTECVGHISKEKVYIKDVCPKGLQMAQLTSIYPMKLDNGDRVILPSQLKDIVVIDDVNTLIIRTMPNEEDKLSRSYSGTNPPYFALESMAVINDLGIKHLITDLPSVDREVDEGKVLCHKTFWNYPGRLDTEKTITEMVFVPNYIKDGIYLCGIHAIAFELDAAPSSIILYQLDQK